jgi:hypothetical protein
MDIKGMLSGFFNSTKVGIGFSAEDIKSIVIGALLNALGIALIAIIEQVAKLNWGLVAPIATGLAIVLVNLIRKWLPAVK